MEPRKRAAKEYREILSTLAPLRQDKRFSAALRRLEMGWLTPGTEILRRIEKRKLPILRVLGQHDCLHRKWFEDLSDLQKGRWINLFRGCCDGDRLKSILQLTLRRLQQLQKLTQPVIIVEKPEEPDSESSDVNEPSIPQATKSPLNL